MSLPSTARRLAWLLLGALLLVAPSGLRAETVDAAYRRALADYYGGRYAAAAQALERLAALPLRHEALFYNLGCAYYRLGRLGPAVYAFERALALESGSDDARHNLRLARQRAAQGGRDVLRGVSDQPAWQRAASVFELRTAWWLTLILWWAVLAGFVLVRRTAPGPARAGLVAGNALLGLLLLASVGLLGARIHLERSVRYGIVLPDKLAVREGPEAAARSAYSLHAGLRVRLVGEVSGWRRLRLGNGLEGWVRSDAIGPI
ncbi:MAG: tetratricopeptide repeat protein [Proteobacteria bacterium]|nr:tetratricopeptide repeat protein [Pseudomonadota bacterium]